MRKILSGKILAGISGKRAAIEAGCIVVMLALDRAAKLLAEKLPAEGTSLGLFRLRLTRNTGAAFSIFSDHTWLLAVLTGLLVAAIGFLLVTGKGIARRDRPALLLLFSGGAGNLIDRVLYGYVTDMIEPTFVRFAVFNVADIFVCVGAGLWLLMKLTERPGQP